MPFPWMTRTSSMFRSRHADRYSRTTSATSFGRKECRSSTPSMGHSIGSSMIDLRDGFAPGGLGDESRVFLGTDLPGDGPAGLLEPREVPQVWEVPALLRLYWLDGAISSFEEHT